jgi:hypothetical protein
MNPVAVGAVGILGRSSFEKLASVSKQLISWTNEIVDVARFIEMWNRLRGAYYLKMCKIHRLHIMPKGTVITPVHAKSKPTREMEPAKKAVTTSFIRFRRLFSSLVSYHNVFNFFLELHYPNHNERQSPP